MMQNSLLKQATGMTAQGIKAAKLKLILVPIPPLGEQKRIVAKVDRLMALCDELEAGQEKQYKRILQLGEVATSQLLTPSTSKAFNQHWQGICDNFDLLYSTPKNVSQLRQAILQLAVMGKLVPQDPNDEPASVLLERIKAEKELLVKGKKVKQLELSPPPKIRDVPFELVEGWKWAQFCDVATIASNLIKPEAYWNFQHVAPDNIEKQTGRLLPCRTVGEDNVRSGNHRFFSGQILYSKIRPNLAKAVLVDFEGLCSADMYPINAHIDSNYLLKYMLSPTFLNLTVKKDTRVAMPKINQEELHKILVPVPPLNEQHRIVTKVNSIMALCDDLEAKLKQSINDREKLMETAAHQVLAM